MSPKDPIRSVNLIKIELKHATVEIKTNILLSFVPFRFFHFLENQKILILMENDINQIVFDTGFDLFGR